MDVRHQRRQKHLFMDTGRLTSFQLRQCQQVSHQGLDAVRLNRHELQVMLRLGDIKRNGLQGFHKTAQNGQWGADFVRHVGHKIPPHRIGLGQSCDVTRQEQQTPLAIRMQLQ